MQNFDYLPDHTYLVRFADGSHRVFSFASDVMAVTDQFRIEDTGREGTVFYQGLTDDESGLPLALIEQNILWRIDITDNPSWRPEPIQTQERAVIYTLTFRIPGLIATGTLKGGVIGIPRSGEIVSVMLGRVSAGSSSSTILDLNPNGGTTLYTNQANRPTIAFDAASLVVDCALPAITSVIAGSYLSMDVDQAEPGAPADLTLLVSIQPY